MSYNGKIMKTFYSYLVDDGSEDKKNQKAQKKCVIKRELKFEH